MIHSHRKWRSLKVTYQYLIIGTTLNTELCFIVVFLIVCWLYNGFKVRAMASVEFSFYNFLCRIIAICFHFLKFEKNQLNSNLKSQENLAITT